MDNTSTILKNNKEVLGTQGPGVLRLKSSILHRSLAAQPLNVECGRGSYLYLKDGKRILDASSGAAVACIGHGNDRVRQAVYDQMAKVSYIHAQIYTSGPAEELADVLIDSTEGKMSHCLFMSSGISHFQTVIS